MNTDVKTRSKKPLKVIPKGEPQLRTHEQIEIYPQSTKEPVPIEKQKIKKIDPLKIFENIQQHMTKPKKKVKKRKKK